MEEQEKKKISMFGLNNILTYSLKTDANIRQILEENGIQTYKDLEDAINKGKITNKFLIEKLNDVKEKRDIKLKDVSTEVLKINKEAALILDTFEIKNFADLGMYIGNSNPDVINDIYLMNAFKVAAKNIAESKKNKVR